MCIEMIHVLVTVAPEGKDNPIYEINMKPFVGVPYLATSTNASMFLLIIPYTYLLLYH